MAGTKRPDAAKDVEQSLGEIIHGAIDAGQSVLKSVRKLAKSGEKALDELHDRLPRKFG